MQHNIVGKKFKQKAAIPGTIDNEIAQGAKTFLAQKPSHHKSQSMTDLKAAPMKVMKDKDGMFVRRTILGDANSHQQALKKIRDMRRYSYNRKRDSQHGKLNQFMEQNIVTSFLIILPVFIGWFCSRS